MYPGEPDQTHPDISPSSAPWANHWLLPLPKSLWGWGWAAAESSFCNGGKIKNESMRIHKYNGLFITCCLWLVLPESAVSPCWLCLEGGGVPDEPIQGGQEWVEGWPVPSISLPALKHQGVQGRGAVVGGREAILVCYSFHHLEREQHNTLDTSRAEGVRSLV